MIGYMQDDVMDALKRCHNVMHQMGVSRTHMTLKLGTRLDKPGYSMDHKIARIKEVPVYESGYPSLSFPNQLLG